MRAKDHKVSAESAASQVEESRVWAIARRERDRIAALAPLAPSLREQHGLGAVDAAPELSLPVTVRAAPRKSGSLRRVTHLKWLYARRAQFS